MSVVKRASLIEEWVDVPLTAYFETTIERERRWTMERHALGMVAYHSKPRWERRPYERREVTPIGYRGTTLQVNRWVYRLQENEEFILRDAWISRRNYAAWLRRKRGETYPAIAKRMGLSTRHTRQIVLKQDRIQLWLWRNPLDTRIIRGESPIHDELWTE